MRQLSFVLDFESGFTHVSLCVVLLDKCCVSATTGSTQHNIALILGFGCCLTFDLNHCDVFMLILPVALRHRVLRKCFGVSQCNYITYFKTTPENLSYL